MNVYSNIVLEFVKNNYNYRLEIPFGAAYADAELVAEEMGKQIKEMARIALENAKKADEEKSCKENCEQSAPVEAELV